MAVQYTVLYVYPQTHFSNINIDHIVHKEHRLDGKARDSCKFILLPLIWISFVAQIQEPYLMYFTNKMPFTMIPSAYEPRTLPRDLGK